MFRNTVRVLLNQQQFITIRKEIEDIVDERFGIYSDKFSKILEKITILLADYVQFVVFDDMIIENIKNVNELANCLGLSQETCQEKADVHLCTYIEADNICQLLLPKEHLISGHDNKKNIL